MPTPTDPAESLLVHDGFVRALARSLLADRHAAEDVAQETWVAALERGAAAVSLPQWLSGVVRKRAGKHVRSQERRVRREREAARGAGTPSGEEILEREAVRARVVAAVLALEEPYRESVLLRFFESLPPRAIAARLGVPVETVRTRLKRALEMLRARLDREHGGGREAWSVALLPWAHPTGGGAGGAGMAWPAQLALGAGGLALATVLVLRALAGAPVEPVASAPAVVTEPAPAVVALEPGSPATAPARSELVPEPAAAPFTAETGSLRATVRWSDGTPAAGIQGRFESSYVESPFFRARRNVTDAEGVMLLTELPPGRSTLTLDRDSGRLIEIEAGVEATFELTLPRGFDVEGLVVDREGAPVAGAELWLSDMNSFTGSLVGTAGADGRFELRSCLTGHELGAYASGHAPSLLASLSGEDGARLSVRLVLLGPGGEVSGTVRGPEGEPLADAQVLVGSEQHEFRRVFVAGEGELVGTVAPPRLVRTDAEGRFRALGVPPGRVPLAVRAEGCALWRSEVALDAAVPTAVEATLEPEASLFGRVLDEHEAPVLTASLQLLGGYGLLDPTCTTGPDGVYRLAGLASGSQVARVQKYAGGSAQATFELAAGEERAWDPVVGLGLTLSGRVLDESGAPLSGWSIDLIGRLRTGNPSFGNARTDAEGRFLVKSLEDVPYHLTLEGPGSSVPVLERGVLRPDGAELQLRVPASRMPSARVRGSVVDASGAVPANLALELATASFGLPSEIDAEGRFELGPFVPGLYTLRVRAQGHVEHVLGPRRLAADETWDLGTIVLESPGSLAVSALRAPGTEALEPWFRVHRASDDGCFELGPVEAAGAGWRREALAPGPYVLEVAGNGVASALVPFELHAGEALALEVPLRQGLRREVHVRTSAELGATRVRLRVLDAGGEILVEDELWPRAPGDYRSYSSFEPGLYRVVAELPDGPRAEAELRIAPDEYLPLVLELR
jgi:RNA polymerase sigma factor (sigma-70 family)